MNIGEVRRDTPLEIRPGTGGLWTEGSGDVIRVVVCALHPLRPSWPGASEESGPDD